MGSVISFEETCPFCGKQKMAYDYYYKSGERYVYCPECGYSQSVSLRRNQRHEIIWRITGRYPIDGTLCLVTKELESQELLETTPLTPDMTVEEIARWINAMPVGQFRWLYHERDLSKPLFSRLARMEIENVSGNMKVLLIREPIWQTKLTVTNRNGVSIKVTPLVNEGEDDPQEPPYHYPDYHLFTVKVPGRDTVATYRLTLQAIAETGIENLVNWPEKLKQMSV